MGHLKGLGKRVAFVADSKGFSFTQDDIDQKLLLAVSEICEAQEELRDGHPITEVYFTGEGKPEGFPVEIADAIIRLLHICANFDIEIDEIIEMKLDFNTSRPMKHGRKF